MTTVFGQLDGMANDTAALQGVSDNQTGVMQNLSSIAGAMAATAKGQWGVAAQGVSEQLHTQGMQQATMYADHSGKMQNNATWLANRDDDNTNIISQVGNLI